MAYFVFKGKNASTGCSNRRTGRMSFYGEFIAFESKAKALKFVEDNTTGYVGDICVAGTKRTLRKYYQGISVADYNEYMDQLAQQCEYDAEADAAELSAFDKHTVAYITGQV